MEETIRKLKQFIEQISKAEAEADVFRILLFVTPGAKRKIFQSIDEAGLGQINYDDICTYCGKEGLNIPEGDWEIVGRYFRNWHKGITFD